MRSRRFSLSFSLTDFPPSRRSTTFCERPTIHGTDIFVFIHSCDLTIQIEPCPPPRFSPLFLRTCKRLFNSLFARKEFPCVQKDLSQLPARGLLQEIVSRERNLSYGCCSPFPTVTPHSNLFLKKLRRTPDKLFPLFPVSSSCHSEAAHILFPSLSV